jgi:hypothetical protein
LSFHGGQPVIENDNIGATGTTRNNDDTKKKMGKIILFHYGDSIFKIWMVVKKMIPLSTRLAWRRHESSEKRRMHDTWALKQAPNTLHPLRLLAGHRWIQFAS